LRKWLQYTSWQQECTGWQRVHGLGFVTDDNDNECTDWHLHMGGRVERARCGYVEMGFLVWNSLLVENEWWRSWAHAAMVEDWKWRRWAQDFAAQRQKRWNNLWTDKLGEFFLILDPLLGIWGAVSLSETCQDLNQRTLGRRNAQVDLVRDGREVQYLASLELADPFGTPFDPPRIGEDPAQQVLRDNEAEEERWRLISCDETRSGYFDSDNHYIPYDVESHGFRDFDSNGHYNDSF
jgi:hypothetical protein